MNLATANFHRLQERLRLRGQIVARSALHLGGGPDHVRASCELPVLADGEGFPLIPGSSLKGTVRATVEGLLRAAAHAALRSCDPLEDRSTCGSGGGADAQTCAVCSVFGTRGLASHVRISDARVAERGAGIPIELREGMPLDRDLRTAQSGRRYELEVVSPGTAFELEIFIDNAEPWMLGLLLLGLDQLDGGYASLGGFASRGLGRVAIEYRSLERSNARSLLAGEPPVQVQGDELGAELQTWRRALVERASGGN